MLELTATDRDPEVVRLPPPLENHGFLGVGGQGTTWLALDPKLNRLLVCKRFQAEQLGGKNALPNLQATFAAQAKVAATTSVVPQIYGVEYFEGAIWLLLEFVEGVSLQNLISAQKVIMGDSQLLIIVMDLLNTLMPLKTVGLVHGDLTPANILVNTQGQIRLIDFSSSVLHGSIRPTAAAPGFERHKRAHTRVSDFLDDQYALGCVIYWLLADDLPIIARDQNGQTVIARPPKPEELSAFAHLLWESAALLTGSDNSHPGILSDLSTRYRQQIRSLSSESRRLLGGYAVDSGVQGVAKNTEREQFQGSNQSPSGLSAVTGLNSLTDKWARLLAAFTRHLKKTSQMAVLIFLIAIAAFTGYQRVHRAPSLTVDSLRVAANTALPPGFSHDWLVARLERIIDQKGLELMAAQSFVARLDCDHDACVLTINHQVNGLRHVHQQSFSASVSPQIWESVITELGRAVAAR